MTPFRIVSMDGGGIRGILTARLLERIDQELPGFLNSVDLFAGTSTGGLLALGLASGYTPEFLRKLYEDCGNEAFADSLIDNIKDLGNLIGAQYSIGPLKKVLEKYFYGKCLSDLQRRVLIATFQLDNHGKGPGGVRMWKMKFFHNFPGPDSDGDQLVVDVAVRTAAAPSYFPVYQGFVDGGVAASNPAMCALAQALHRDGANQPLENVHVFSLGTGYNPHYLPLENEDWGLAQWAPHMLDIMLESSSGMVDYQMNQVLEERYFRLNSVLPKPIGMDAVAMIPDLRGCADDIDIAPTVQWIKEHFI